MHPQESLNQLLSEVAQLQAQFGEDAPINIRPAVTSKLTGLSDRQLRRLEAVGKFPKRFPVYEGSRAQAHNLPKVLAHNRRQAGSAD